MAHLLVERLTFMPRNRSKPSAGALACCADSVARPAQTRGCSLRLIGSAARPKIYSREVPMLADVLEGMRGRLGLELERRADAGRSRLQPRGRRERLDALVGQVIESLRR